MYQKIEIGQKSFFWGFEQDIDCGFPWDEGHAGYGEIETRRSGSKKAPHEVIIGESRFETFFYDVQASMKKAKAEGWGIPSHEAEGLTRRQIIAEAIARDIEHCKQWVSGARFWVCLKVWQENDPEKADYLGGVEYCSYDSATWSYVEEIAQEMAQEMAKGD